MGSVEFGGEDESQPSTSNGNKLPKTLLDGCRPVNHASVPKKLRSGKDNLEPTIQFVFCNVIKKRGRESISITIPLQIPKQKHHMLNKVDKLRKYGTKKSKLTMRDGNITKDEEEVAETLYALAGMFSEAKRADQPSPDHEQETKSFSELEVGGSIATEGEDSRKISSKVTLCSASHSLNMVDSTTQIVKSQSLGDQHLEFFSSKQPLTLTAPRVQFDLNLGSRPPTSSGEREINLVQIEPSEVQYGKNYNPFGGQCKDMLLSPNLSITRTLSSETQRTFPSTNHPALFENANVSSQARVIENSVTTENCTGVATASKNSWKRCTTHIYISRLIKALQISDGLTPEPIQLNGTNSSASQRDASSEIQNNIILHKRPVQDQKMASQNSVLRSMKQGYDFLLLGTGARGLENGESVDRAGPTYEPSRQYLMSSSFMQSQDCPSMLFSLPQIGYSSTFHSHNSVLASEQQVQRPQYHSNAVNSNFTAQTGQQMEPHQQKWPPQLHTHYNTGGGPLFPDWKNGGTESANVLNYAHAFPHLHAALGQQHQQFSPSQEQVRALNSSSPLSSLKRYQRHLSLGFERNGAAAFGSENIQQLHLPCNERL